MASDPEELLAAIDDAEVIGTVTDALGDFVKVGVIRTAVLIGVSGSPAILDTPGMRDEFARYWMEACRQAEAAGAVPAPKVYYACCIHCEHNGESDPDLDDERHPNPCREGCPAVTAGQVAP